MQFDHLNVDVKKAEINFILANSKAKAAVSCSSAGYTLGIPK